jgi:DNA modification methylase
MNRVEIGDCRAILPTLPAGAFQTCVTSPPYFGLRDYGTARWEGGDPACDHKGPPKASERSGLKNDGRPNPGRNGYELAATVPYRDTCGKCGATRHDSQIGLEPTPDAYVAELVAVFREVRRVLRDDGTLWLNLGDSYAGSGKGGNPEAGKQATNRGSQTIGVLYGTGKTAREAAVTNVTRKTHEIGAKPKDLLGIPWRVAFALQADGWYLRSDIIWSKPNPMPESVTDRPTKAHEYLFLLSKSERYYYGAQAIAEPAADSTQDRAHLGRRPISDRQQAMQDAGLHQASDSLRVYDRESRNRRSVWTIPTTPYSGAHFAVMPEKLVEPCILAGSREGDVVLDPFFGSGTVGQVAERLGRRWFGCELNPAYRRLIEQRTAQVGIVFERDTSGGVSPGR